MRLSTVFHVFVGIYYVCVLIYDYQYNDKVPSFKTYGGRLKFLTHINMLIQTAFFLFSALVDLFGTSSSSESSSKHREGWSERCRDFFFASLAFPIAAFITTLFWILYFVDRELIYPKTLDELVPWQMNLIQHLYIAAWIVLDCMITHHRYPTTSSALAAVGLFGACYTSWVFWIAHHTNTWVYPVLAVVNVPQRVMFFIANFGLVFLFFFAGRRLSLWRWSKHELAGKKER